MSGAIFWGKLGVKIAKSKACLISCIMTNVKPHVMSWRYQSTTWKTPEFAIGPIMVNADNRPDLGLVGLGFAKKEVTYK